MIDAQAILLFIVCLSRKKSVDLHYEVTKRV